MSEQQIKTMQAMTLARAIDLISEQERRIAELEAALSRRPAAVAEELAPQDVSVLRRWAEQIERMASVFNDERSLLCQQAAILLHRIAYRPAEVAAEQPAAEQAKAAHVGWRNEKDGRPPAAGNALTDEQEHAEFMQHFPMPEGLRASVYDAWQHDQLRRKEGWEAAIKHLRAAPQAAQGKGLTIDTPQFRVLVSSVAWESRTAPSDAFEAALNRLIAHIDQTIAAHTRASDGEDSERLDFLATNEAWIAWTKDGESCRVFHRNEDGDCEPIMGWVPEAWAHSPREAIDAAMQQAASKSAQGGA